MKDRDLCRVAQEHKMVRSPLDHIKTSQGHRNLVPIPSPTTSAETSVCAPRTVAERVGSVGFVLLITLPNLG